MYECGYYVFLDSKIINDIIGFVLYLVFLVFYYLWRISYVKYYWSINDMDYDEVFVFSIKVEFGEVSVVVFFLISNILNLLKVLLLGWLGYLLLYVMGRKYYIYIDYFNFNSFIFSGRDYRDVVISDIVLVVWMGVLVYMVYFNFFMWLLKVYIILYFIVNFWLVFIIDL